MVTAPPPSHPSHAAADRPAQFWLMKSEPDECSIDDALAAPKATVPWTGVRNYQENTYTKQPDQFTWRPV